ncbi:MAG: FecR domain-containing protein [Bacteroidota bacterium]
MTFYGERVRHLLRLFIDNKATEQEITEMLTLLRQKGGDQELEFLIMEMRQVPESHPSPPQVDWENIWDTINQPAIQPVSPVRKMKWLRVAAAVIILTSISAFFYNRSTKNKAQNAIAKIDPVQKRKTDGPPGGSKAILTLSNGSQIILDSAANGLLAQQGNTHVIKSGNGQLVYKGTGDKANEVLYNTVGTPRGGQYSLILPDGSRIWLNASSSIHFPTVFAGKERRVEITGEAYFEITKNPLHPFRVSVNAGSGNGSMEVEVLGTHFNINAYKDEPAIKTTLLEGSVKVSKGARLTIIKPGEQIQLTNDGEIKVIHDADLAEAVAWKDGRFEFKNTDMKTIMRQVMRWYDVDVEYYGDIPDRYFTADISRNKSLSGLLRILELSGIDFKLEGKKLIVSP